MLEKHPSKNFPDRPLECTECKKPIMVRYTEVIGSSITHTSMCSECPELRRRLYGTSPREYIENQAQPGAGLECGNCQTALEEVKRGHRLGCSECYVVFEDVLLAELQASHSLPPRIFPTKKNLPVHIGRIPGEVPAINLSSRLLALDEALKETLNREDYEQAAWLRDQIKALTDNPQSDQTIQKDTPDEQS